MNGQSANFVWANRGKQSVVLDLRDEGDRAVLSALIAGADVFVHNMAPDAARRARIDADTLVSVSSGPRRLRDLRIRARRAAGG